ncbi:MAG: sodium/proton-translocating pyrophosphatase [Desulfosudis oleivorans]|nr:sodium/proton-translocating pyrophosphatase [Desulfosudis oleivorans]
MAFGFLGMGPVTIAVDSYGPVTDNAQSVYELSQIEGHARASRRRSRRTSASSPTSRTPSTSSRRATARATPSRPPPSRCSSARRSSAPPRWSSASSCCSKNMLRRSCRDRALSIVQPEIILGLIMGGAVIYWFTGASMPGGRHRRLPRGRSTSRST